jgi:hypothetical protein
MGALDGISTYVVDLDASGRGRGVTRLQSGDEVYCSDVVAGSASVVNVAIELGAMPLMGSISLSGCPDPRAAVVRFALGESAPVPGGGVGLGAVQRGGLRLASDGEGGYLVGLASVGSGDANLGSGCGAGGPSYSIDVLRLDSGGARLWARRIVEVPEISDGALTLDVTRSGDRAVVLAALDAGGATSFRVLDAAGAEVSPARARPRLALGSRRLADGDDARLQIDDGSLASFDLVGREPDVAVCGQTPRGTRSGVVSSFFGMSAPSGFRVVVAGLRPPMSPAGQWVLTSTSVDGDVTACAPDSNGGLWVAPLFPGSGLFFDARTVVGSGLVHLEH